MAINLKSLSKPDGSRPIIATLFGEGGMGKTTLGGYVSQACVYPHGGWHCVFGW
jgi:hypothetical protein